MSALQDISQQNLAEKIINEKKSRLEQIKDRLKSFNLLGKTPSQNATMFDSHEVVEIEDLKKEIIGLILSDGKYKIFHSHKSSIYKIMK